MSEPDVKAAAGAALEEETLEGISGKGATALLVSADARSAEALARLLRALGWSPFRAASDEAALRAVEKRLPSVIIVRLDKPEVGIIERVHALYPTLPVITVMARPSLESAAVAYEAGAAVCTPEPVTEPTLQDALRRAVRRIRRLEAEQAESLRLLDSARAINASLLFSDIYPLTLDTLLRETQSSAAVGIFADPERGELGVRAARGVSTEEAEKVAHVVAPLLEGRLSKAIAPVDDSSDPDLWVSVSRALHTAGGEPPRLLLVPIPRASRRAETSGSRNAGAVLLLRGPSATLYTRDIRERAAFLATQAGIAIQNGTLYAAAEERAYLDPLTGLYNTRYLYATLDHELSRCGRYNHDLSVLFLDLDRFKEVNDQHNHLVGSAVLVETAHLIERKIRQVDSAVRYGGDEFTIVLVETAHAGAVNVAERIRESVEEHVFQEAAGLSLRLTCSIGVASYPGDGKQARELIEASDVAMYRAKVGRNRVCSAHK